MIITKSLLEVIKMDKYDIIIIGAGPGGLTAAIYAGRQGTKNLMIDRDLAGGIGREVPEMENYPGFDSISGLELIEKMKEQAIKNTELHEMEEVEEIIQNDGEYRFTVKTSKGEYIYEKIHYLCFTRFFGCCSWCFDCCYSLS